MPNRRRFLKGAAAGAAALAAGTNPAAAQQPANRRAVTAPSASALAEETGSISSSVEVLTADRPGADFMVDVLKSLGFEYICANPGSSFRGLHESIVNYGRNKAPELIPAATKSNPSRWPMATQRSKASRWPSWPTAP
jgi:acetolactate synthase-1/2/3 large subunit